MKNSLSLKDLVTSVEQAGHIKPSRLRCISSSVKRYAELLGCNDGSRCTADEFVMEIYALYDFIDQRLSDASPHA